MDFIFSMCAFSNNNGNFDANIIRNIGSLAEQSDLTPESMGFFKLTYSIKHYTCVIFSIKFDRIYIGKKENCLVRIDRHNSRNVKSTKPYVLRN